MRFSKINLFVFFASFCICFHAFGNNLINYLPEDTKLKLSRSQQQYYETAMSWPYSKNSRLATINMDLLKENTVVINFNNTAFTAIRSDRNTPSDERRKSWIGKFQDAEGDVHIVFKDDEMVAFIAIDFLAFVIRPLGDGLHAVIEWDMTLDDGCQTPPGDRFEYQGMNPSWPMQKFDHQDLATHSEIGARSSIPGPGECNVRVLVAYSDDTDNAVPDVLMDIINMVNLANTGYQNSSTGADGFQMSIELAAAFEVNYGESGDMGTDLDCITDTGDGCLDDIHTQRQLWSADQCMLLTSTGSGLGWVSTDFEDQFTVVGVPNFYALSFHHELGHNAECTHAPNQATQPGTSPFAGWGEPTVGCFRTVMAYPDACGTGPCPRQNIFSDDDTGTWVCDGTSYTPGTIDHRNQDRLTLSFPILVGHETVGNNVIYGADYNWQAREAVHVAATSTLAYSSPANNFEFFNGSQGSFRAGDAVTLGEGFWARSGSQFRAYLDNCGGSSAMAGNRQGGNAFEIPKADLSSQDFTLEFSPNPFSGRGTIAFDLFRDAYIELLLLDQWGRTVLPVIPMQQRAAGHFSVDLDVNLPSGLYLLKMTVQGQVKVLKVVGVER